MNQGNGNDFEQWLNAGMQQGAGSPSPTPEMSGSKVESQGFVGDTLDLLGAGAAQGAGGIFDFLGADGMADRLYGVSNEQLASLSPEMKEAMAKPLFVDDPDSALGFATGDGIVDPRALYGNVVQTVGQMALPIPGGAIAGRAINGIAGVTKAAKAIKAADDVTDVVKAQQLAALAKTPKARMAEGASTAVMGGLTASMAGGMSGQGVYDEIINTPYEELAKSPEFQQVFRKVYAENSDVDTASRFAIAREELAKLAESARAHDPVAFGVNAVVGGMGDKFMLDMLGRKVASKGYGAAAFTGGLKEGVTETFQEGSDQYRTNVAMQQYADPERNLMQNVPSNAATGGLLGFGIGAPAGIIGRTGNPPAEPDPVDPDAIDTSATESFGANPPEAQQAQPSAQPDAVPNVQPNVIQDVQQEAQQEVQPDVVQGAQQNAQPETTPVDVGATEDFGYSDMPSDIDFNIAQLETQARVLIDRAKANGWEVEEQSPEGAATISLLAEIMAELRILKEQKKQPTTAIDDTELSLRQQAEQERAQRGAGPILSVGGQQSTPTDTELSLRQQAEQERAQQPEMGLRPPVEPSISDKEDTYRKTNEVERKNGIGQRGNLTADEYKEKLLSRIGGLTEQRYAQLRAERGDGRSEQRQRGRLNAVMAEARRNATAYESEVRNKERLAAVMDEAHRNADAYAAEDSVTRLARATRTDEIYDEPDAAYIGKPKSNRIPAAKMDETDKLLALMERRKEGGPLTLKPAPRNQNSRQAKKAEQKANKAKAAILERLRANGHAVSDENFEQYVAESIPNEVMREAFLAAMGGNKEAEVEEAPAPKQETGTQLVESTLSRNASVAVERVQSRINAGQSVGDTARFGTLARLEGMSELDFARHLGWRPNDRNSPVRERSESFVDFKRRVERTLETEGKSGSRDLQKMLFPALYAKEKSKRSAKDEALAKAREKALEEEHAAELARLRAEGEQAKELARVEREQQEQGFARAEEREAAREAELAERRTRKVKHGGEVEVGKIFTHPDERVDVEISAVDTQSGVVRFRTIDDGVNGSLTFEEMQALGYKTPEADADAEAVGYTPDPTTYAEPDPSPTSKLRAELDEIQARVEARRGGNGTVSNSAEFNALAKNRGKTPRVLADDLGFQPDGQGRGLAQFQAEVSEIIRSGGEVNPYHPAFKRLYPENFNRVSIEADKEAHAKEIADAERDDSEARKKEQQAEGLKQLETADSAMDQGYSLIAVSPSKDLLMDKIPPDADHSLYGFTQERKGAIGLWMKPAEPVAPAGVKKAKGLSRDGKTILSKLTSRNKGLNKLLTPEMKEEAAEKLGHVASESVEYGDADARLTVIHNLDKFTKDDNGLAKALLNLRTLRGVVSSNAGNVDDGSPDPEPTPPSGGGKKGSKGDALKTKAKAKAQAAEAKSSPLLTANSAPPLRGGERISTPQGEYKVDSVTLGEFVSSEGGPSVVVGAYVTNEKTGGTAFLTEDQLAGLGFELEGAANLDHEELADTILMNDGWVDRNEFTFRNNDIPQHNIMNQVKGEPVLTQEQAQLRLAEWKSVARQMNVRGEKTVLSLFDSSGVWSQPYRDAGYNVIQLDKNLVSGHGWESDLSEANFDDLVAGKGISEVSVILAACPCTDFTNASAQHFAGKDLSGRTELSIDLLQSTMNIIEYFKPDTWAIENPAGRINQFAPIGSPTVIFDPSNFGEGNSKETHLYGAMNTDLPVAPVDPKGSKARDLSGNTAKGKWLRSLTPEEFAYAFFMANGADRSILPDVDPELDFERYEPDPDQLPSLDKQKMPDPDPKYNVSKRRHLYSGDQYIGRVYGVESGNSGPDGSLMIHNPQGELSAVPVSTVRGWIDSGEVEIFSVGPLNRNGEVERGVDQTGLNKKQRRVPGAGKAIQLQSDGSIAPFKFDNMGFRMSSDGEWEINETGIGKKGWESVPSPLASRLDRKFLGENARIYREASEPESDVTDAADEVATEAVAAHIDHDGVDPATDAEIKESLYTAVAAHHGVASTEDVVDSLRDQVEEAIQAAETNPKKALANQILAEISDLKAKDAKLAVRLLRVSGSAAAEIRAEQLVVQKALDEAGQKLKDLDSFVTFDVKGNGKFRVVNTPEAITKFWDRLETVGNGGGMIAPIIRSRSVASKSKVFSTFINDGEYENAITYAEDTGIPVALLTNQQGEITPALIVDSFSDPDLGVIDVVKDGKTFKAVHHESGFSISGGEKTAKAAVVAGKGRLAEERKKGTMERVKAQVVPETIEKFGDHAQRMAKLRDGTPIPPTPVDVYVISPKDGKGKSVLQVAKVGDRPNMHGHSTYLGRLEDGSQASGLKLAKTHQSVINQIDKLNGKAAAKGVVEPEQESPASEPSRVVSPDGVINVELMSDDLLTSMTEIVEELGIENIPSEGAAHRISEIAAKFIENRIDKSDVEFMAIMATKIPHIVDAIDAAVWDNKYVKALSPEARDMVDPNIVRVEFEHSIAYAPLGDAIDWARNKKGVGALVSVSPVAVDDPIVDPNGGREGVTRMVARHGLGNRIISRMVTRNEVKAYLNDPKAWGFLRQTFSGGYLNYHFKNNSGRDGLNPTAADAKRPLSKAAFKHYLANPSEVGKNFNAAGVVEFLSRTGITPDRLYSAMSNGDVALSAGLAQANTSQGRKALSDSGMYLIDSFSESEVGKAVEASGQPVPAVPLRRQNLKRATEGTLAKVTRAALDDYGSASVVYGDDMVMFEGVADSSEVEVTVILGIEEDSDASLYSTVARFDTLADAKKEARRMLEEAREDLETDGVRLSIGNKPTAAGVSFGTIKSVANELSQDWVNAPEIVPVESAADLPAGVRSAIGNYEADGNVEAVYHNGRVYVVADSMSGVNDVRRAILHEVVGHHGLHTLIGSDKDITQELSKIVARLGGINALVRMAKNLGVDLSPYMQGAKKMQPEQARAMLLDELVAHLNQEPRVVGHVQRLIGLIRNTLRRVLGLNLKMTTADVLMLAEAARKSVHKVGDSSVTASPRFSISNSTDADYEGLQDRVWADAEDSKPIREVVDKFVKRSVSRFRQNFVDRYHELYRLDELMGNQPSLNPKDSGWVRARLAGAANGALSVFMHYGKLKWDADGVVMDAEKRKAGEPEGLFGVIDKLGSNAEVKRFFRWIASNRARALADAEALRKSDWEAARNIARDEWLDKYGHLEDFKFKAYSPKYTEHLLTPEHIEAGIRSNNGRMADGRNRAEVFAEVHALFNEYHESVLKIASEAGIVSEDAADAWKNQFYIPFHRVRDDKNNFAGIVSDSLSRQDAIHQIKGSGRKIGNLLENYIMNTERMLDASLKNKAAKFNIDSAVEMGFAQRVGTHRDNDRTTYIMEDGKRVYYEFDFGKEEGGVVGQQVYEALMAMSPIGMNSTALKFMRNFKRLFTASVTSAPSFVIRNLIRDSLQSVGMETGGGKAIKGAKLYGVGGKMNHHKARMLASGGAFSFGHVYGDHADEILASVGGQMRKVPVLTPKNAKQLTLRLWDAWGGVSDSLENANRASVFEAGLEEDLTTAAFRARDLMDFSARGAAPAVRFLTSTVPFMGARIQGLDKLWRHGTDKNKRERLGKLALAVAVSSLLIHLRNHDDEDFKKLPDWQRDSYWFIKASDDFAIFIPKPFEIGALGSLAERLFDQTFGTAEDGALSDFAVKTMMDTFSLNPTPHAFKPAMEVWANRDEFRDRDIETYGDQFLPPSQVFNEYSSYAARGLSSGMEAVMGNSALSAKQIDHLVKGYFGFLGTFVTGSVDAMVDATADTNRPERHWWENSQVRWAFRDLNDPAFSRQEMLFYDMLNEYRVMNNAFNDLRRSGRQAEAARYYEKNRENIVGYRIGDRIQRAISMLRRKEKLIKASGLSPQEKRKALDAIKVKKAALANKGLDLIK